MALAYFTAEAARTRLIAFGKFTTETAPSLELLTLLLETIERRIDAWVGYRQAATEYTEQITANSRGIALMREYPVIAVHEVKTYHSHHPGFDPVPIPMDRLAAIWNQGSRLGIGIPGAVIQVRYTAGHDPIPVQILNDYQDAVWTVLSEAIAKGVLTNGGNFGFLDAENRVMTSISLPGGLSKGFKVGGSGGGGNSGSGGDKSAEQVIDKLLSTLERYRRRVTF